MIVNLSQMTNQQLDQTPTFKGLEPVLWAGYEPQTFRPMLKSGATTVTDVWRLEVERKQIYIESNLIATGTQIAFVDTMKQLRSKRMWPGEMTMEYPVAFSYVGRRQGLDWSEYEIVLQKAIIHTEYQDEAKIVGDYNADKRAMTRRTSEAVALTKDNNILGTLSGSEYAVGKDVGIDDKWDNTGANPPDIFGDFAKCMEVLQDQAQRPDSRLEIEMFGLLPLNAKPWLRIPDMVNQQRSTVEKLVAQIWNIEIMFTRNTNYANDGTIGYKGEETITHGVLSTNAFPMMEEEREIGRGGHQVMRQYFGTKTRPYAMGQTTSKNLVSLTDIFTE